MFQNLEEYYHSIELQTDILSDQYNSKGLIKLIGETEDENMRRIFSYELYIEDFNIFRNALKKKMSFTEKNGVINDYPDLDLFEDDLGHLKLRAQEVLNPKLKAKYNHLLWLASEKNRNSACIAVDNYLTFLKDTNFDSQDLTRCELFCKLFENLFLLSCRISYKNDIILEYLKEIIGKGKINIYKECSLMSFIAANAKKISCTLKFFSDYWDQVIADENFAEFRKKFLELQIVVTQLLAIVSIN